MFALVANGDDTCVHVVPLVPGDVAIVFPVPAATNVLFPYRITLIELLPNEVVATEDHNLPSVEVKILPGFDVAGATDAVEVPITIATVGDAAPPYSSPLIPVPQNGW